MGYARSRACPRSGTTRVETLEYAPQSWCSFKFERPGAFVNDITGSAFDTALNPNPKGEQND